MNKEESNLLVDEVVDRARAVAPGYNWSWDMSEGTDSKDLWSRAAAAELRRSFLKSGISTLVSMSSADNSHNPPVAPRLFSFSSGGSCFRLLPLPPIKTYALYDVFVTNCFCPDLKKIISSVLPIYRHTPY